MCTSVSQFPRLDITTMGTMMSAPVTIAASVASAAATRLMCCCSSAACNCCNTAMTPASSTATRVAYAALFLVVSVLAWTTQAGWIDSLFSSLPYVDYECPPGRCSGPLAVLRMMFALTVFHLSMALITIGVKDSSDRRTGIQNGWWGVKVGAWIALTVVAFLIPNQFFTYYGYTSYAGSVFFLFVQLVLLIDFAASWSEDWVGKYEDTSDKKWVVFLIGAVAVMLLSSLVLTILLYVFFCTGGGCGLNIFFVTFNLILGLIACGMCVHPRIQEARPSSGLLQGATVFLYMTYLITSAISGEVNDATEGGFQCNPFANSSAQQASTIIGTLFTFVVIAFSTTRAAAKSKLLLSNEAPPTESAVDDSELLLVATTAPVATEPMSTTPAPTPSVVTDSSAVAAETAVLAPAQPETAVPPQPKLGSDNKTPQMPQSEPNNHRRLLETAIEEGTRPKATLDESDDDKSATDGPVDDERNGTLYNYSFFHFIFSTGAMYIAMLLTNWNMADPTSGSLVNVGHDWATVWVKVVCSWVVFGLFIWTLIAPIVLPNRIWS